MRRAHVPTPRALLGAALAALAFPAVAAAQVAVFDGRLETTAGGFRFGDVTLQTTAATGGADYAGILVVDQRGGGDSTSIQAAIDAIGTTLPPASAATPYLVRVAPGVFSEQVTMKRWVDLEGAGEGATKITWTGAADFVAAYTVRTVKNTELRFLTVENTGGAAYAHGVAVVSGDPTARVYRVTVDASGGTTETAGVRIRGSGSPLLQEVTATAVSAGNCRAFYITTGSPTLLDVDASASGEGNSAAIRISSSAEVTIRGGIARATGTAGSQRAVEVGSSSATITGLTMLASGGGSATALALVGSPTRSTRVQGSRLEASGANFNLGVRNLTEQPVRVHSSAIVVPVGQVALSAGPGEEIDVASSLVDGTIDVAFGGTYVCVASFDGSFAPIGSNCL